MATVPAAVLSSSLSVYVDTLPSAQRLASYLAKRGLAEQREEIQAVLDAAIKDTGDYLWRQDGGVRWDGGFEDLLYSHLELLHPWLTRSSFKSLVAYGGWLCWHEGLNA